MGLIMPPITITYFGISCFLLDLQTVKILIDPGKKSLGRIKANFVYATHRHFDHTRGLNEFLEFNPESSVLICNEQVAKNYTKWGDRVKIIADGDLIERDQYKLEFIAVKHGVFSGELNIGIIVHSSSFSFGHLGDAISFDGFADKKLDMLAVPIVGMLTASPSRAIKELENFNKPLPIIVPMHWIWRRPKGFCRKLSEKFPEVRCIVPRKDEVIPY